MRFPGIIPAVTTPFASSGEIDVAALESNLAALLDAGVHGIVATGTMGEAGSLSTSERRAVVAAVVRAVDGRVPVIAGISSGTPAARRSPTTGPSPRPPGSRSWPTTTRRRAASI
jgi:dihydrodipicolinate synthase/N-acetylneuraminate lyase